MFDMSEPFVRPDGCKHPAISDAELDAREDLTVKTWGNADPLKCGDCGEYLYPHDDGENVTVYAGEPYGAGEDWAGRPSPSEHPEYWTE